MLPAYCWKDWGFCPSVDLFQSRLQRINILEVRKRHLQRRGDTSCTPVYTQAHTATQINQHCDRKNCISYTAKSKDETWQHTGALSPKSRDKCYKSSRKTVNHILACGLHCWPLDLFMKTQKVRTAASGYITNVKTEAFTQREN